MVFSVWRHSSISQPWQRLPLSRRLRIFGHRAGDNALQLQPMLDLVSAPGGILQALALVNEPLLSTDAHGPFLTYGCRNLTPVCRERCFRGPPPRLLPQAKGDRQVVLIHAAIDVSSTLGGPVRANDATVPSYRTRCRSGSSRFCRKAGAWL